MEPPKEETENAKSETNIAQIPKSSPVTECIASPTENAIIKVVETSEISKSEMTNVSTNVSSTSKKNEPQLTQNIKPTNTETKNEARNKRLDRSRKKNEKNHEIFLKSIQSLPLQDQNDTLVKKLNEMMEENLTLNNSSKFYKNQSMILEKEKEQLRTEHNKTLMARTRLENVCRELQNNYKQIKDETAQKIREEEEKRKEVTTKFQATLADVSKMMEQNSSENLKLRNDNIQISDRFKKLCEEFKAREEDVQRISKQLGLEKKLSEANLARCQLELEAERCEKEVWLKEKEAILRKLHEATKDKLHMEMSMKNMEDNLSKYSDKYQTFESTITKSNEIFEMYKTELASMSKQVTKLEADCITWKERWMQTSQAVNRLIGVNQSLENDLMLSDKKLDQLASLCRFLQNERNCYLKQLKENNIKPEVTSPPDEKSAESSESKPSSATKETKTLPMTAKERELQALRNEIIKLQAEINKAVEKEMEEKKTKQQEIEKNKRRAKNKKNKKSGKNDESKKPVNGQNSVQSTSPVSDSPLVSQPKEEEKTSESHNLVTEVVPLESNSEETKSSKLESVNSEINTEIQTEAVETNATVKTEEIKTIELKLEEVVKNGEVSDNISETNSKVEDSECKKKITTEPQNTGAPNLEVNNQNGALNM